MAHSPRDRVQYEDVGIKRLGGVLRPLVRVALVGLAFGAGFVLVYSVTVRTVQGRLFGDASLRGALLTRSATADGADTILNVVSVASLAGAVALVTTVALVRLERLRGLAAVGILVGSERLDPGTEELSAPEARPRDPRGLSGHA